MAVIQSYSGMRRPLIDPPPVDLQRPESFEAFSVFVQNATNSLKNLINAFQFQRATTGAGGGIANLVVTWTIPMANALYSVSALPSWTTAVSFSNQTTTTIQLNFGTATPAGAQTILLIAAGG